MKRAQLVATLPLLFAHALRADERPLQRRLAVPVPIPASRPEMV